MPYKLVGKKIYSKATGKWKLKQTAKSVSNAKKALALLHGLESGSIKKSDVGKGKFAKKSKKTAKKSVPAGMHRMPNGKLMKDSEMKKFVKRTYKVA